jgi:hypothetical protein
MAGGIADFVIKHPAIRAGINAQLTAGAGTLIDNDAAILFLRNSSNRTDAGAEGVVTMKADDGHEVHVEPPGEPPGLDCHDLAPA